MTAPTHPIACPECHASSARITPVEDSAIDVAPFFGCLDCGHLWARPPYTQEPSERDSAQFRASVLRRRERGIS